MDLSERIAEQVARIPMVLKPLFEKELGAGNTPADVEIGRGEDIGKVALVFKRTFHSRPSSAPPGVKYRESERKFGRVLEFVTDDDSFSLLTVKFKEIVRQKIIGPTNPTVGIEGERPVRSHVIIPVHTSPTKCPVLRGPTSELSS